MAARTSVNRVRVAARRAGTAGGSPAATAARVSIGNAANNELRCWRHDLAC